jgi:hypothetical protein
MLRWFHSGSVHQAPSHEEFMKRAVLLFPVFFGAACTSDTTAPRANVLVGTWGGAGLLLTAQRSTVHAVFDCDDAEFPAPLSLNSNGEFVLPGTTSRSSASVKIGAHGVASGDTITIEVIRWYAAGSGSQQFTVVRNEPALLTALCAISGNGLEP